MGTRGTLIGDPVGGAFAIFTTLDQGTTWNRWGSPSQTGEGACKLLPAASRKNEALFAASNASLLEYFGPNFVFTTGGPQGPRFLYSDATSRFSDLGGSCKISLQAEDLPLASGASSTGAFAMATENPASYFPLRIMVVGGDYAKPDARQGTAALIASKDGFHLPGSSYLTISIAQTPPHGYRSSVDYDPQSKTWITVGPNGTDISRDDGRNWQAVHPSEAEPPDADKNWNALSLPFVVGPHGRIGILTPAP